MKSLKKITIGSLVLTLAFFAGSFCLHPTAAQAMDGDAGMDMSGHEMGDSMDRISSGVPMTVLISCVSDCASEAPQAMAVKKFIVDFSADMLSGILDDGDSRFFASSSGPTDLMGMHPPAPDILSSVFKKE